MCSVLVRLRARAPISLRSCLFCCWSKFLSRIFVLCLLSFRLVIILVHYVLVNAIVLEGCAIAFTLCVSDLCALWCFNVSFRFDYCEWLCQSRERNSHCCAKVLLMSCRLCAYFTLSRGRLANRQTEIYWKQQIHCACYIIGICIISLQYVHI